MAASATLASKAGVWFRRARLCMVAPDSQGTACPSSGRNSTYRPVQIYGASSFVSITPQGGTRRSFENVGFHFFIVVRATNIRFLRRHL
jgi:hypothetical protein